MEEKGLSPMMQHYDALKKKYQDCIIFYRLGDFYEMFSDDAVTASRVLGLTLTARKCGNNKKAHMCGVPAKSLEIYLRKLIEAGFKVAVCEQLTDPKPGTIVIRDVVKVVTPGTVIESSLLDSSNNYLAVFYANQESCAVSWLDISTGELNTTEFRNDIAMNVNDLFSMIQPKEILANDEAQKWEDVLNVVKSHQVPKFIYPEDIPFEYAECLQQITWQFGNDALKQIDCTNRSCAVVSTGALLRYVATTQKRSLVHINHINYVDMNNYMQIDANTRKHLELTSNTKDGGKKGTLYSILDKTKTNMGKRTLKKFIDEPLLNETKINHRLSAVDELVKNIVYREQIRELLSDINDIERLTARVSYNNLTPKDCLTLASSLRIVPTIKELLKKFTSKVLVDINKNIYDFSKVSAYLSAAIKEDCTNNIKEGNFIKKGFNSELDNIIDLQENSATKISQLENAEREATGIKNLKIGYNRVFGYYIEVLKSSIAEVPFRYIRKQTLTNAERYISEELKNLEEMILSAADRKVELEVILFEQIRSNLLKYVVELQQTARAIGVLDTLLSFATIAVEHNYCKPIISKANVLEIIEGRHPVVESAKDIYFIPNDTIMNNTDARTMLITGPNMAGKSTYMRQVALINLMAQIGSFVPARSAKISIVDRIFTRIGASDDIMLGQSTFMVEMTEVSNILKYSTNRSLILLDEIGRGTSTFDGLSIAWAVMEYIAKNFFCKTLFSTHFHELTDLEGLLDGIKNYKVMVKQQDNKVIFLRKIARGCINQSFGIEVAALANLPPDVLDRARQILRGLEQHDLNKNLVTDTINETEDRELANYRKGLNEIGGILKDLDINTLTPLSAFDLIIQLQGYIKKDK